MMVHQTNVLIHIQTTRPFFLIRHMFCRFSKKKKKAYVLSAVVSAVLRRKKINWEFFFFFFENEINRELNVSNT